MGKAVQLHRELLFGTGQGVSLQQQSRVALDRFGAWVRESPAAVGLVSVGSGNIPEPQNIPGMWAQVLGLPCFGISVHLSPSGCLLLGQH